MYVIMAASFICSPVRWSRTGWLEIIIVRNDDEMFTVYMCVCAVISNLSIHDRMIMIMLLQQV